MSASLVGSEMCIRDSVVLVPGAVLRAERIELGSELAPEDVLGRVRNDDERVRELVGARAGAGPEAARDRFSEEEEV
eukprot:11205807-Alexandrium_andersonii.AAC.1